MEGPIFLTEVKARRELARLGLVNKLPYQTDLIQFDLLNDPRCQRNIEAKQGRFQLDRYRPFTSQQGNLIYNPRDNE